jgi:hypothetical protein
MKHVIPYPRDTEVMPSFSIRCCASILWSPKFEDNLQRANPRQLSSQEWFVLHLLSLYEPSTTNFPNHIIFSKWPTTIEDHEEVVAAAAAVVVEDTSITAREDTEVRIFSLTPINHLSHQIRGRLRRPKTAAAPSI